MTRRPVMTDELAEALAKWAKVHGAFHVPPITEIGELIDAVHDAYRNSLDAAEPLKVPFVHLRMGQRVRLRGEVDPTEGRFKGALVDFDGFDEPQIVSPDSIEPIPELPDDSLERHWVVGAWIRRNYFYAGVFLIVLDKERALKVCPGQNTVICFRSEWDDGLDRWRFADDSPIKEKSQE